MTIQLNISEPEQLQILQSLNKDPSANRFNKNWNQPELILMFSDFDTKQFV